MYEHVLLNTQRRGRINSHCATARQVAGCRRSLYLNAASSVN